MLKITTRRKKIQQRRPVEFDAAGNPIPQNLTRHLIAAELPDADFDNWLAAQYAREDRDGLNEMFAALEHEVA